MSEPPNDVELDAEGQSAGYEDFGDYMEAKKEKLLEQQREDVEVVSEIFKGLKFHVNGLTSPGLSELRQMILENGGQYQQYFYAGVIMIATHLPEAKIKKVGKDMVVVRPEWVVDCVREKELLDMNSYRLYSKMEENGSTLTQFVKQPQDKEALGRRLKTSASPNFVQDFYQSSRLHHLSKWRAELKGYAAQLMASKPVVEETDLNEANHLQDYVMHVDMDCFFVSVSARGRADLEGRPVAVSHSAAGGLQEGSSSDLASVNYEARAFGLFNGMYTRRAMQLCPSLVILPYDFEAYHQVSLKLYDILAEEAISCGGDLEAISCDEAMVWVSLGSKEEAIEMADRIRAKIKEQCQCNASIGIGSNKLIARLATKKAKPNGRHVVNEDRLEEFMGVQKMGDLPGIGNSLESKLIANGWRTCADLWPVPLETLQTHFGPKLGENIYQSCRGQDPHYQPPQHQKDQKSVGSEISWGVRFETEAERNLFIMDLVNEVMARQEAIGKVGQKLHVKMYARKAGAGEPHKRLGRGECDVFNKTITLKTLNYTPEFIANEVVRQLEALSVATVDIRGIGIFFSSFKSAFEEINQFDWNRLGEKRPKAVEMDESELNQFLLAHGVEPSVYKELPESVQKDLLSDLNTIDDETPVRSVPAKRSFKSKKDTSSMTITQFFKIKKDTPGSPSKKKKIEDAKDGVIDLTLAGIDQEFFDALPDYLKEEILEEHRQKAVRVLKNESSETKPSEMEYESSSILEEEFFDEASILGHANLLLAAENYEQLSRDLSRLRRRFPEEIEPIIVQIQEQFYQKEGSSLYIP